MMPIMNHPSKTAILITTVVNEERLGGVLAVQHLLDYDML